MPIRELKDQIARLPEQPGVYLYLNAAGETIYVGKARALRDRVRNYLGAYGADVKTDALLDEVARLEVIVTDSVVEALALENNLIKQRSPKYNIRLRDDKNYPYLQLTATEAFPRVLVARRFERDGNFYAGPFMPARFARKTMALTHRLFGIRSCNEVITGKRDRPCLEYDIKRCIAPCVDTICTAAEYGRAVALTELFLEGRNDELLKTLKGRMIEASEGERYEEAAQLRDAMRTVQTLHDRQQKMARTELGHRDVFGLKLGSAGLVVQVFQVRSGRVVERVELGTETAIVGATDGEVLEAAIQQFYELRAAPPDVHVPAEPDNRDALETWLADQSGRRVKILVPQRGEKRGLVELANRNAALAYQNRFNQATAAQYDALETLRAVLALPALPRRIECFDISTIQGSETVASMVVCEDGRMKRSEYRKYRDPRLGARGSGLETSELSADPEARVSSPESRAPGPGRFRSNARGRPTPLPQAARGRRTISRFDPDRRRQGPAVGGLRGARGARARESRRGRDCEEGGAPVHARSRRADCAADGRSGVAAAAADSRRGTSLRGDVSSTRPFDARPPFGARPRARHRAAAAAHAAQEVWQPRRRQARDTRRAGGRSGTQSGRCGPCVFRGPAVTS